MASELLFFLTLSLSHLCVNGELAHRVHNVVLYPRKHAWCEAKPIQMVVAHEGCENQIVYNHICVGQCFAYHVPKTEPSNPVDKILHYCDTCAATKYMWMTLFLNCKNDSQPFLEKEVQLVQECACVPCFSYEALNEYIDKGMINTETLDEGEEFDENDDVIEDTTYSPDVDGAKPPSAKDFFLKILDKSGKGKMFGKTVPEDFDPNKADDY